MEEKQKLSKKKKIAIGAAAAAAVLLIAAYGAGTYYCSSRFGFRTSINGRSVSGMTVQDVKNMLESTGGSSLTVTERDDITEEISLDEINYSISADEGKIADLLKSQNPFSWPAGLFRNTDLTMDLDISYDSEKLDTAVRGLYALSSDERTAPQDAYIDYVNNAYEIIPETDGTTAVEETTISAVHNALDQEQLSIDLNEAGCYMEPSVRSDDENLQNQLSLLHDVGDMVLTIDLSGAQETLKAGQLADLLVRAEDGTVSADDAKLTAYVDGLEQTYNTIYTSRQFTTHSGDTVSVGGTSTDTYGWMMNVDSTKQAILDAINSHTTQTVSAFWDVSAWTRNQPNGDIGNTYIEISISAQHLWFYKSGQLVYETDVITGLPVHNQDTPKGVFRIWSKKRNAVLKGTAWDGSTWNSPVSFWMPITWTGVGLHDANWQSAFGGKLYLTRGSHGCVNLSYSAASYIFNNAELNTPVIIY